MSFDSETPKTLNNEQTRLKAIDPPECASPMYMFTPKRLYIADHPEIDVLPLNILYAKSKVTNGQLIAGVALYTPDLTTLELEKRRIALTYRNPIDGSWSVVIEYDIEAQAWTGTKRVCGKTHVLSQGNTWECFFKHLTMLGLQNGEPCQFINMPETHLH